MPKAIIAIDLFSGAGGFSSGLSKAGVDVLFAADNWDKAVESYRRNFIHPVLKADLAKTSYSELCKLAKVGTSRPDLVVGGPPCQGFSVQRIGKDEDARNNLVLEYARLLVEARPRLFLMENVLGLVGSRGKDLLKAFLTKMASAGYLTSVNRLNACDYGVPQQRRRTIVAGWLPNECAPFTMPEPSHRLVDWITVRQAFSGLATPPIGQNKQDPLHKQTRMSALNLERIKLIGPGQGMENLPVNMRVKCHQVGAGKIGHRYVYGRLPLDAPAGTITARFDSFTRGRFGHPDEPRNMTLREGARLQTFPDSYIFVGNQEEITAQIGNAVPPTLAAVLAAACVRALQSTISARIDKQLGLTFAP